MELRDQGGNLFPTPCMVTAQPAETQECRVLSPSQPTLCSLGPVVLLGPRLCRISGGWAFCPPAVPTQAGSGSLAQGAPPRSPAIPQELECSMGYQASPSLSRPLSITLNKWDPDRHRHSQPQAPRQSLPGPPGTSELNAPLPAFPCSTLKILRACNSVFWHVLEQRIC